MATLTELERQGVYRDEKTGELFLPATQRPDGTWRKPRRVKEGYIPPDEVPTYENKGVSWMKSREGYIPGLVQDQKPSSSPDIEYVPANPPPKAVQMSKSAKKNAKRREKRKQQAADGDKSITQQMTELEVTDQSASSKHTAEKPSQSQASSQQKTSADPKAEIMKRLRNLRKKLKQIEDLKARIESGDLKHPEKEQLEKIAKHQAILDEIEDLELELDD